jgi:thiamine biosynthesis lipoprotein
VRKLRPGVQVDVAGIAPGYAVDCIAERLRRLHVDGALVEIGGEVRAWGRNPDGEPWRIAIEAPVAGERRAYALAELDDMSISTSGDYRDFRIVGGRRISHTIDPRTGAPVTHDLASVTVLHRSAMSADAYATALMVMGPESGLRFAEQRGLAALFLERVPGASGWRERVTPQFTRLRRPLP